MRIKNALKNSFFSIVTQVILILFGFFSQRVVNLQLGKELVGMNGVISNILALLSVSELGIAVAVTFHLYRAIDAKDEVQISSLMNLFRKSYYVFAAIIGTAGLLIMPFVHIFLRENTFSLGYVRIIYGLWLLRTIASYLLSYKRSILIADQKEYIVSVATLIANSLNYLLIIVIVEWTQNYVLALSINIVVDVLINLWISIYVGYQYPFLKKYRHVPLNTEVVTKVFKDVKNIFVTRLSTKLLLCTDSLIMSSFINVAIVGLYSNYNMITQSLTNIVVAFSNALQPTAGNMFIEEDHAKEYGVLRQVTFVFFLFASFSCTCLFALMTPFITDIWLTSEYALDISIILWCVINFYMNTMLSPLNMMMSAAGLFKKERNISIVVAVVNIVLSLLLVNIWEIPGVLVGTFVAYSIQLIYRIIVLVCNYMKADCKKYVIEFLQYILLTVAEVFVVYICKENIYQSGNLLSFFLLMIICILVPNGINILLYFKSWRFSSIFNMLRNSILKRKAEVISNE